MRKLRDTVISVCVPYWHRQQALDRMLANYADVYGDIAMEFSICDDGSHPPVRVRQAHKHQKIIVSRLATKNHPLNPCVPINTAVRAATGSVIVLTNPEVEHPSPVLWEMLLLLGNNSRAYVTAPCKDVATDKWFAGPDVDYRTGGRLPVPPGAHFHFCAVLWRELWDLARGFDEDYRFGQACDDNDWVWRLADVGAEFLCSRGIVLHTATESGRVNWGLPHNAPLFERKWPAARRAAITHAMTLEVAP